MEKVILFDMDGTLIDSTNAIYESFCAVFDTKNLPKKSRDEISKYIGYTLEDMFRFLGVDESLVESCTLEYKRYYKEICNAKTTMLPSAIEAIKLASNFAKLGVVTTKTSASSAKILGHFGVEKYFSSIIGREDVINTKPHKEPILNALKKLNIKPSKNVYMIGDTILDLQAANSAKVTGVGVLCGYGKKEELEKFSNLIFANAYDAVQSIVTNK